MARLDLGILIIVIFKLTLCSSVDWEQVKCSEDADQKVPEGPVPIGRFPWLGLVQHTFYMGGKHRFAVTAGILIHPGYVIASAEDIGRVPREQLFNNTKFIMWLGDNQKYVGEVQDYLLHPEYEQKVTFATLALLELLAFDLVVLPVCMPITGLATSETMYSVRFSDVDAELHKEMNKMDFVTNSQCEEFYYLAGLTYDKMTPRRPMCAVVKSQSQPCVWDAGVALITRQSWGHWMILGFGTRGAGCGAPARFLSIHDYVPWIDDVITKSGPEETERTIRINFRRQSPVSYSMYSGDTKLQKQFGRCADKKASGGVLFKESSIVLSSKSIAQGYYFLSVGLISSVKCVKVDIEAMTKSNAGVWVEHQCHRDRRVIMRGNELMPHGIREEPECFMYYRSNAYVELRFYFSFRVKLEITVLGNEVEKPVMPNPNKESETTLPWLPTADGLHRWYWHPVDMHWNNL